MTKELNTKKDILEHIEEVRKEAKAGLEADKIQAEYDYIYRSIEAMAEKVKVNTIVYLKTELRNVLGKYVITTTEEKKDYFIESFEKAYAREKKTKAYDTVLCNPTKMKDEQFLNTIKYINVKCVKGEKLTSQQKADVLKWIQIFADKGDLHLINLVRCLSGLNKALRFKIIQGKKGYKVVKQK